MREIPIRLRTKQELEADRASEMLWASCCWGASLLLLAGLGLAIAHEGVTWPVGIVFGFMVLISTLGWSKYESAQNLRRLASAADNVDSPARLEEAQRELNNPSAWARAQLVFGIGFSTLAALGCGWVSVETVLERRFGSDLFASAGMTLFFGWASWMLIRHWTVRKRLTLKLDENTRSKS